MNEFENALRNLYRSVVELKHYNTEASEKSEFLTKWTKTLERTTKTLEQITEQIVSGKVSVENLSYEQKIIQGLKEHITYLNKKIEDLENDKKDLENKYNAQTKRFNQLFTDSLAPDSAVSDELDGYELKKDFYPLCENLKKSLENRFPLEDSTQKEIDDFKEYLRLAFLRETNERTNELKNALNERYGRFIEEYDTFIDALYDSQRGGRLFGEYGLYLLDLNEEACQKLFKGDCSYLNCVMIGGRPVKYYDDKREFVECKGETNYQHTEVFEVLFPGFCVRCRNSDDILLLIPPYIYQRPEDKTAQEERPTDC